MCAWRARQVLWKAQYYAAQVEAMDTWQVRMARAPAQAPDTGRTHRHARVVGAAFSIADCNGLPRLRRTRAGLKHCLGPHMMTGS